MKKIFLLLPLVLIFLTSCDKKNAVKDVDDSLKKINAFNATFEKMYTDSIISTKSLTKDEADSEYEQLKKIANEYYKSINKINDNIAKEQKKVEAGDKKKAKYKEAYLKALSDKKAEIDEATKLFEHNLNQIKK